jgi:hypothetical protein
VRDVVSDVKALNKIAVWIPVENDNSPEQGVYERSFTKMDNCESHIDFTTIAPQPHYYQVTNTSPPDGYRPGGMTYNDLKAFKASCKSRGWGVEFECDTAAGGTDENCGCGQVYHVLSGPPTTTAPPMPKGRSHTSTII